MGATTPSLCLSCKCLYTYYMYLLDLAASKAIITAPQKGIKRFYFKKISPHLKQDQIINKGPIVNYESVTEPKEPFIVLEILPFRFLLFFCWWGEWIIVLFSYTNIILGRQAHSRD